MCAFAAREHKAFHRLHERAGKCVRQWTELFGHKALATGTAAKEITTTPSLKLFDPVLGFDAPAVRHVVEPQCIEFVGT